MNWFAAMMIAAQATSGAAGATAPAQSAPALTSQQKQELSTYNFKGAGATINAQANQPVPKPGLLTPIPPLQVPPLASRNTAVNHRPLALRPTKARRSLRGGNLHMPN